MSLACIPVSILWFHCLINLFVLVRSCVRNFGLDKMRTLVISDPSPTRSVTGLHVLLVSHTNTSTIPDLVTERAHTLSEVPVFTSQSTLQLFFFLIQRLLGKKKKNWLKEWKKGRGDEDNKISLREMLLFSPSLRPTLQPHGLRHARLPPLSHRVCSNSCPSRW